MATRSSARLAALSPPPPLPPRTDTVMTRSSGRPSVASEIWTGQQVEEFKAAFLDVSNVQDILKPEFVPGVNEVINMPKQLVSEGYDGTSENNDLLVQGFLDTLSVVQTMFMSLDENERNRTIRESEAFTRHLLYDFVRMLMLSNRNVFTKQEHGDLVISPASQMGFRIGDIQYLVMNDGAVGYNKSIPVTFETKRSSENEAQILAQILASALSSNSEGDRHAYVIQIHGTKLYIHRGTVLEENLANILSGNEIIHTMEIYRYPPEGFDLVNEKQRVQAYRTLYGVFRECISRLSKPPPTNQSNEETIRKVVVINGHVSEAERYLYSLSSTTFATPQLSPRRQSPRRLSPGRSQSPKRGGSPKRKHTSDADLNESPRPVKKAATAESVTPIEEPVKPVKLNPFGFGSKLSSSPWAVPAPSPSPTKSLESQSSSLVQAPKKTFGFGAAASGVSPFAAVGQSSSAWSGWDHQKPTTFEKRSLFDAPKPSKKEDKEKEKDKEDESDGDDEDDGDENESGSDPESQLENGEEAGKPKVDMREQAGEADEETLYETTCTLYEIDPKTSGWVSKGTGIIHVNIDKESVEAESPKKSRLIMRQSGTMKVMWNVRLFKGMKLLPRQVSEGDRRMDVYVRMVLVDDGRPKSYAIKLRNHSVMDELYFAIERAIPK